jgi:hypothetical protein
MPATIAAAPLPTRKPREDEIDVHGVTHPARSARTTRTISSSARCGSGSDNVTVVVGRTLLRG